MDDCIRGIKKRKRAKDQVDQTKLSTTNQARMHVINLDTSYWNSRLAKKLFVPLVGEYGLSGKTH
jgi:hypothetical protein